MSKAKAFKMFHARRRFGDTNEAFAAVEMRLTDSDLIQSF